MWASLGIVLLSLLVERRVTKSVPRHSKPGITSAALFSTVVNTVRDQKSCVPIESPLAARRHHIECPILDACAHFSKRSTPRDPRRNASVQLLEIKHFFSSFACTHATDCHTQMQPTSGAAVSNYNQRVSWSQHAISLMCLIDRLASIICYGPVDGQNVVGRSVAA